MTTSDRVLKIAFEQVGYAEKGDNLTKFGAWKGLNGNPWCGMFVDWVFNQARVRIPSCTYTPAGAAGFERLGRLLTEGIISPGDVVFFDFPHDGVDRISHVGIAVHQFPNGDVLTIEGNTTGPNKKGDERNGGEVALKRRKQSDIVCFGTPKYKPCSEVVADYILDEYKAKEVKPAAPIAKKAVPPKKAAK